MEESVATAEPTSEGSVGSRFVVHEAEVRRSLGNKSSATLSRYVRTGRFPPPLPKAKWPGKERVWRRSDVDAFFAAVAADHQG